MKATQFYKWFFFYKYATKNAKLSQYLEENKNYQIVSLSFLTLAVTEKERLLPI